MFASVQSRPDFGVLRFALIKLFYMQYYTRKFYNQSACHNNNHTQNYAFQPEETNLKPHIVRSSTYGAPNSRKSSTLKSGRKRALAGEGWGPLQGPKVRVHSRFEFQGFSNVLGILSIDLVMTKFEYGFFSNCSKRRKKKGLIWLKCFILTYKKFVSVEKKKDHHKFSIFKLRHIQIGR